MLPLDAPEATAHCGQSDHRLPAKRSYNYYFSRSCSCFFSPRSLDYASETAVQEALDELLREHQDMTTVIIAHRLRTVRHADRIVVLQDGRVVEQGTHEELLEQQHPAEGGGGGGVYREMVERAGSTGLLPES